MESVYAGSHIEPVVVAVPKPEHLVVFTAALNGHYGLLTAKGRDAFVPAWKELREQIVPTWTGGEPATLYLAHATTLATAVCLLEDRILNRYRGERGTQKARCEDVHPGWLSDISKARGTIKKLRYTTPGGCVLSL